MNLKVSKFRAYRYRSTIRFDRWSIEMSLLDAGRILLSAFSREKEKGIWREMETLELVRLE